MTTRAKFKCTVVEHNLTGKVITLQPVVSGSVENESFYRYTPCGEIKLGVVNDAAAAQFVPGAEYYVDFVPANTAG